MAEFVAFAFTAMTDFESVETKSHYVNGLSYTARDEALAKHVAKWIKDGKVRLGGPAVPLVQGTD